MIALLLSLYRGFGKREIKEENEREYARMPVRARENTTQHFKADGLSGCQLFIFRFSSDRFPFKRFCWLHVKKNEHECAMIAHEVAKCGMLPPKFATA